MMTMYFPESTSMYNQLSQTVPLLTNLDRLPEYDLSRAIYLLNHMT